MCDNTTTADEILRLRPNAVCTRNPSSTGWKVYDRIGSMWSALSHSYPTKDEAWADALDYLRSRTATSPSGVGAAAVK